jgi:hypothetical protein
VPTSQTTRGIANGRWEPPAPRSSSGVLSALGRIGLGGLTPKALLTRLEKAAKVSLTGLEKTGAPLAVESR